MWKYNETVCPNKEYKKALRKNTTYRKGVVEQEVRRDAARKYLSSAKKIEKQLSKDPSNKSLKKDYSNMMNKYGVERAKGRNATVKFSRKATAKTRVKRVMKGTLISAGATATAAGVAIITNMEPQTIRKAGSNIAKGMRFMSRVML